MSDNEHALNKSYFPIKIQIVEENHADFGKIMIVENCQIPNGISFRVLETGCKTRYNYRESLP